MNDAKEIGVDFAIALEGDKPRRYIVYYKRPQQTPIPVGKTWRCVCRAVHVFSAEVRQYCDKCGTQLRHQENAKPEDLYHTCVIVSHFNPRR